MGHGFVRRALHFISLIILLDIASTALVVLVCWLKWRTFHYFPTGIFIAGIILITIGFFSYSGSSGRSGLFDSQYKYSKDSEDTLKRVTTNMDLLEESTDFALIVSVAGSFLILLSFLFS